jgi:hypothetical protein
MARRNDRVFAGDQFEDERRENAADHRPGMRFITSAPVPANHMIGTDSEGQLKCR